jgi:hypothetical protein
LLTALLFAAGLAQPRVWAQDTDIGAFGLSYVQTPDMRLVYFEGLGYLAPYALRTFATSHAWQRRMFGWTPSQRTTVLLKDFTDYGGGAAWAAPLNTTYLDVAPPLLAFETSSAAERMYSLMNHELVHVAASDSAADEDLFWRVALRGKVAPQSQNPESLLYAYLTAPRFNAPRWYLEGSAVFLETWMGGGIGRAQGGYDEMVFRAMVRENAPFYDPLGLASRGVRVDFQVSTNAYLYGTRFVTYLAHAHSPQKVIDWLRRDAGSARHYAAQFERVFGRPLEQAWQEWIAFEREFQRTNLDRVRAQPVTPYRVIGGASVGSISRTHFDEASGIVYGAFRSPGRLEHVGALDTRDGSYRALGEIRRGTLYRVASFAFDPTSGTAFYTNNNHAWRDLMALDVKSREQRLLMKGARIGDMVFNPVDRSLLGIRHENGLAQLVRIAPPYEEWRSVHQFPYGVVPSDLDLSRDGKLLSASVSEVNSDQFVRVWPLDRVLAGEMTPSAEFKFGGSVPESFVFSRDGKYLYGSSYFTGVSNIFRAELATGQIEAVSNAEIGFFRPAEMPDGRLFVLAYTAAGFVPATIEAKPLKDVSAINFLGNELVKKHPVVTTWQVANPATVDADKIVTARGPYHPLKELQLVNAYPVLQGYKSNAGIGYRFNFEDPIRFAQASATVAWTPGASDLPGDQRAHVDLQGSYLGWRAALSWNHSDFYDLFGPTKRSRKGWAVKLGYDDYLIWDEPRTLQWVNDLALYGKIDTLPEAQNVGASFTRLRTVETQLKYSDVRRSLGAVDDEKGWLWNAALGASRAGTRNAGTLRGNIDVGLPLPGLAHSSLWLRTYAGIAVGDRDNPNAAYYFGSFGNNVVDHGTVKRYRGSESMPGFEINQIGARRYLKQMLEWTLPSYVFEDVGWPGFHANWLRPAVFAAALWADDPATRERRRFTSLGAQADLRLATLHWYEMVLSVGYGVGYERSRRVGHEWMVSLKLL